VNQSCAIITFGWTIEKKEGVCASYGVVHVSVTIWSPTAGKDERATDVFSAVLDKARYIEISNSAYQTLIGLKCFN